MSDNLNKILGQLEEDLKKLQSAKEQVESVVASNQEFAIAANNLIVNTESLLSKIEVATEGTIGQFSQKLELSKDAIDKIVKDGIGRLDSNIEKIELANQKLKETTEVKVNEVSSLANNSIEKIISQSLTTIKDVSSLSKSAIEEQKNENLKSIDQFSQKLNQSKDAIDKIVKDGIDRFNSSVDKIESANQKLKETTEVKVNEVSGLASSSIEKNITQSLASIKDISTLAKIAVEEQKNENLKTLNQILETHNQIKQLIGQLLDFDLPNILRSLNNNIEKQQKQSEIHFQEMKKMQTWSLIGFGVLVVVMIVFKFL